MACVYQPVLQLWERVQREDGFRAQVLAVATVDCLALLLAVMAYRWWSEHPLYGKNKGTKVYPIIGSLIGYLKNKHRILESTTEVLIATPGHTTRLVLPGGITNIATSEPSNVEYILKTNFENYPKGDFLLPNMREFLGDGIFNADGKLWKMQRKVASHEFSTRSLREFVVDSTAGETFGRLLPVLDQAAKSGRTLDLQDVFARFAFDNICQLAFGVDPACLDAHFPQVKFAGAFDDATHAALWKLQTFPKLVWRIQSALNVGQPKILREAVREIDEFAMGVIQKRRQEIALAAAGGGAGDMGVKTDLLSRFMGALDSDSEDIRTLGLDFGADSDGRRMENSESRRRASSADVFLRDVIISFVLAGRDTSTSAMSWFFWLLSHHPEVEQAILDEISRMVSSRSPAIDMDSSGEDSSALKFSFEELKSMYYLHAALTESMRLYPPVPDGSRTARKADVWPDGTVIGANDLITYHPYAMGRMEDIWGKDCLEFRPERWLKDGVFVQESPYKYTTFQAGPRICLGKDMVMLQMKLVCAAVIRNFELSIPQDYNARPFATLTLRLKDGLPVRVRRRPTHEKTM